MGYSKTVFSGFSWQSFQKISLIGISFVKLFILARLLTPADFGLLAIVLITLGLLESFTESGINFTIIQSKHSVEKYVNTAWLISILRGFVISFLMILLGFILSIFYQNQELLPLVGLAALIPIIKGFINPAIIKYQKQFQFHLESFFHLSRLLVEAFFSVILVFFWPTVTSLIIAIILASIYEVSLSFLVIKPWPKMKFDRQRGLEILQNAKGLTLQASFVYLVENLDDLILGKTLGTYYLGMYHNAYGISHKLTYDPAKSVNHGLFPVLTKLSDDPKRQTAGFFKSLTLVSIALFGVFTLLTLFSSPIIKLSLGKQWLEIIPLIPIFAFAGLIQGIVTTIYTLLNANRKYSVINIHLFIQIIILIASVWLLSNQFGLWGAAIAILLTRVLSLPFLLIFLIKNLKNQ